MHACMHAEELWENIGLKIAAEKPKRKRTAVHKVLVVSLWLPAKRVSLSKTSLWVLFWQLVTLLLHVIDRDRALE